MSVVIVDLNLSNLKSLENSLNQIGIEYKFQTMKKLLKMQKKIILPGVGSFTDAMDSLKQKKIVNTLVNLRESKKPLLGICLGMQILADVGNENKKKWTRSNTWRGKRLQKNVDQVPNIGWCSVSIKKKHFIFEGIPNQSFFYFIHGYYYLCNEKIYFRFNWRFFKFPSVICKDNFIGVQFHPEKSYDCRLKNFYLTFVK